MEWTWLIEPTNFTGVQYTWATPPGCARRTDMVATNSSIPGSILKYFRGNHLLLGSTGRNGLIGVFQNLQ
jgi:hypothetical protein